MANPTFNPTTNTWEYDKAERDAKEKLARTKAELRGMLSGNTPFHKDEWDKPNTQLTPVAQATKGQLELNELGSIMSLHWPDNCQCHLSPPCDSCLHPGHPNSLDDMWEVWENEEGWTAFPKKGMTHREKEAFVKLLGEWMDAGTRYELWYSNVPIPPWSTEVSTHLGFMLYNLGGPSPVSHWRVSR
jgi:hypothetical protein